MNDKRTIVEHRTFGLEKKSKKILKLLQVCTFIMIFCLKQEEAGGEMKRSPWKKIFSVMKDGLDKKK